MARLSPPYINGILPAFLQKDENNKCIIRVPFVLNGMVGAAEFDNVCLTIKTVSTGLGLINGYKTTNYYYDQDKRYYIATFDLSEQADFNPIVGQHYKLQIALAQNTNIGYYSSVGVAKCTSKPNVTIKDRKDGDKLITTNTYTYIGLYETADTTEKVYNYKFDLFDNTSDNPIATSGIELHNSSADEPTSSTDTWTIRQALEPNIEYYIQYTVYTINGLEQSSLKYPIIETQLVDPNLEADLVIENVFDDGYMKISLDRRPTGNGISYQGDYILLRASSEDNYNTWYELTRFKLVNWSAEEQTICLDCTVRQGVHYKYAIQAYNTVGVYSNRVEGKERSGGSLTNNTEVLCDFEDAFLFDGDRQLRIRFNPKISSFKSTILESKTDTIGGRYPFIFRNGNVDYKEFAISGMLSLVSDESRLFRDGVDLTGSATPDYARISTPTYNSDVLSSNLTSLTAENYRQEREFKLEALKWLTNGKPKLFRSAAEGNYIVRLMNVSLSPNDTLGRMLHTFNATAYEIAEYNYENLQSFGLAVPEYVETRTLRLESKTFSDSKSRAIQSVDLPHACMCTIQNEDNENELIVGYEFADGSTVEGFAVKSHGQYTFNSEVLKSNPLIRIWSNNWGPARIEWGYYDKSLDAFSYIKEITTQDRITQFIGVNGRNFIEDLEDLRTRVGAFHYMRISPRERKYIFKDGDKYYENHDKTKAINLSRNVNSRYIYVISDASGKVVGYYDENSGEHMDTLSCRVKMSGSKAIDMDLTSNVPVTSASYWALTNLPSVRELYLDQGVVADVVYQENIITYIVEDPTSPHVDQNVIAAKSNWENAAASSKDRAYQAYLLTLDTSLNHLKEEYHVEFAI